jgi:hypothetical protein
MQLRGAKNPHFSARLATSAAPKKYDIPLWRDVEEYL